VKNVDILQVIAEVSPLIGPKDTKGQTDKGPDVHGSIMCSIVMTDIVDLGMAVVAASDAVIGPGFHDLVEFNLTVGTPFIGETRLQEATATATAVVV